jgi:hypothetical protein
MTQSTPGERLKAARDHAEIATMKAACDRYGWPYETYKKHENDERKVDGDMARDYARAYNVPPEWLMWGLNPPDWNQKGTGPRRPPNFRSVPRLTPEQVVNIPELFVKVRHTAPQTPVDGGADIGPRTFSMPIVDDSMVAKPVDRDSFEVGGEVLFDPDKTPRPGDFVAAHVEGESAAVFRKYRERHARIDGKAFDLVPLNSDYPTYIIEPNGLGARIIGVLVRHIRKYGLRD